MLKVRIKEKLLREKLKHWALSHPWLKLIALVLALIAWLYIQGEVNRYS